MGFFAAVLAAWIALFAMQPVAAPPPAFEALGVGWLAALCRADAAETSFGLLFAMWAVMSVAMMAPTAVPAFRGYDDLTRTRAADGRGFAAFVGGYLLAWLGFSAVAASLQAALAASGAVDATGRSAEPWLNVALLAAAGMYQFSSLKAACLSKCRSPVMFFLAQWRPGAVGALRLGLRLGALCIGCCGALMLLAFVGGVMNLAWMGAAALLMGLEKLPEPGRHLTRPLGVGLLATALLAGLATQ